MAVCQQTGDFHFRDEIPSGERRIPDALRRSISAGACNTPIYAAASGVVVESRSSVGYGWIIVIYHGNKDGTPLYTWYAHSYAHQVRVKAGDEVKRGQHISGIGSYGMSTGNHLHFEVRIGKNGQAVDPMSYLKK